MLASNPSVKAEDMNQLESTGLETTNEGLRPLLSADL